MAKGKVKWFSDEKGFGFLTEEGGTRDVFVHHTAIQMKGRRTLLEGQAVEFGIEQGEKGPRAVAVIPA